MTISNSFSTVVVILSLICLVPTTVCAQLVQKLGDNSGIIDESAVLELESTTKGFFMPRMNRTERDAIVNPSAGLMVWCSNCAPSGDSEISIWETSEWKGVLKTNLPASQLFLGNGSGKAVAVAVNGDITITSSGTTAIGTNKVVSDMIRDGTILAKDIASDAVSTTKIVASNVTYSKIQNVSPNQILGRISPLAGTVEEIPITGTLNVVMSNSPTLTGIPVAPTAALNTNTDQIATTAFVLANMSSYRSVNSGQEIATTSTTEVTVTDMSITPGAGIYSVLFNGEFTSSSTGATARGVNDLSTAYQQLLNTVTTQQHANVFGNGETLSAGVYQTNGAGSIGGSLILNGTANDLFIFKINGALSTGAGSTITLTGGAQASNVFWVAISAGAVAIAANNQMKGSFIAYGGTATIGAGGSLEGRLLSNEGAIAMSSNTVSIPQGNSTIYLGEISSYALFTGSGAVSNTGTSTITGNIGTNLGAISGFEQPTIVNGIIVTPQTENTGALTSFSLYQNGTLITNSARKNSNASGQIVLSAIASVANGQPIEVRWKTSLGIVKLQNRILTLIQVR